MATPIEFVESQWTKWQEENPTYSPKNKTLPDRFKITTKN